MELHPMVVHFPIALLLTGVAFDLVGLRLGREDLRQVGLYALGVGLAGALLAVITGVASEERAEEFLPLAEALADTHKVLALTAMALFGALFLWRLRGSQGGRAMPPYTALAVAAVVALTATGYTGGKMVYGQPDEAAWGGERGGGWIIDVEPGERQKREKEKEKDNERRKREENDKRGERWERGERETFGGERGERGEPAGEREQR